MLANPLDLFVELSYLLQVVRLAPNLVAQNNRTLSDIATQLYFKFTTFSREVARAKAKQR